MMGLNQNFLRGSYTPLVTPFRSGRVDFEKFASLVDTQVREGSHGIVVTGTTGEPSSLTMEERSDLVRIAVETVSKRCLLYTSPSPRDRQKSRMPSSA